MPRGSPPSCGGCPLDHLGNGFCKSDGTGEYGVLLLGEALGVEEVAAGGLPFQGKAGNVLTRLIERTKDPLTSAPLERSKFRISNSIFCQPPDNKLSGAPYEFSALSHCKPNLDAEIAAIKPKAILAMGKTALFRLTGLGHQRKYGIEHWRGSVLPSPYGYVIPTFHPSFIMRGNFRYAQIFIHDLLRALSIARDGVPERKLQYILEPSRDDLLGFREEWRSIGRPPLAFDIETPYSPGEDESELEETHLEDTSSYHILRLSMAFKQDHAITLPWQEPLKSIAIEMLSEAPESTVWNEPFDVPRLKAAGVKWTGQIFDAMAMFHFAYPSLPYGLQFATSLIWGNDYRSWKQTTSTEPERYSCHDSATLLTNFIYLRSELEKMGKWQIFLRHFVEMGRVLRKMSSYGVPVNEPSRKASRDLFKGRVENLLSEVQPLIPLSLRPKKVYKSTEESLHKRFGNLESPQWVQVEVELTPKEIASLEKKLEKQKLRDAAKIEKQNARSAKPKKRGGKRSLLLDLTSEATPSAQDVTSPSLPLPDSGVTE